jgi:hypothetical protein
MANPASLEKDELIPPREYSPLAAFLSYLVPGLGQIYQGRVAKGFLFLVCLWGLFFWGMALGNWRNVYIPDASRLPPVSLNLRVLNLSLPLGGAPKALYYRLHYLGQFWMGMVAWPAMWQYLTYNDLKEKGPLLGKFERAPREEEVNRLQQNGDKRWDLGWIYTVIAGVLNILVIYDAFAGPFFELSPSAEEPAAEAHAA